MLVGGGGGLEGRGGVKQLYQASPMQRKQIWILEWLVLKAPPFKSLDLHFSVIKCHCWIYDDNIGSKLKKTRSAILGAYNTFDNRFDQYRAEVCPEIEK